MLFAIQIFKNHIYILLYLTSSNKLCYISVQPKFYDYGDTITSNDLVTRHYENLPYPEVTEEELLREEIYYKHGPEEPLVLFPSHLLEKRNQYLYQGNENFR